MIKKVLFFLYFGDGTNSLVSVLTFLLSFAGIPPFCGGKEASRTLDGPQSGTALPDLLTKFVGSRFSQKGSVFLYFDDGAMWLSFWCQFLFKTLPQSDVGFHKSYR